MKHHRQMEREVIYSNTCSRLPRGARRGRKLGVRRVAAPFVPLAFSMFLDGERLVDIASALAGNGRANARRPPWALSSPGGLREASGATGRNRRANVAKMLDNPSTSARSCSSATPPVAYAGVPAHGARGRRLVFP